MAFDDHVRATDRAVHTHLGGTVFTYAPCVGPAVSTTPSGDPLTGMFDENYLVVDSTYNGVETVAPSITVRLEDLPTDPREEEPMITVGGLRYFVRLRETDGVPGGSIRLVLRLDKP